MIGFTKVKLPYGWMSNMSPHPVIYQGLEYRTTEALFQCLRFDPDLDLNGLSVREAIRTQKSPMAAKMCAKAALPLAIVEPRSRQDLENMMLVLRLKTDQHPDLRKALLETGAQTIIEDVTNRPNESGLYWGAAPALNGAPGEWVADDGSRWYGRNTLGRAWMITRHIIKETGE